MAGMAWRFMAGRLVARRFVAGHLVARRFMAGRLAARRARRFMVERLTMAFLPEISR
jgi:hypothetical protein